MVRRAIGFNSQRDNYDFGGQIVGNVQCFSTCAWMFMAYYASAIDAGDDEGLCRYVDDVEASVGETGSAEDVMREDKRIRDVVTRGTKSMFFWSIHRHAIEVFLHQRGVTGRCLFRETMTLDDVDKILEEGPVIIGTTALGGLKGGHVILLVEKARDKNAYYVNDPYGDARTRYRRHDGGGVLYARKRIEVHATRRGTVSRCLFWQRDM